MIELVVVVALSVAPARGVSGRVRMRLVLPYVVVPASLVTSREYWYSWNARREVSLNCKKRPIGLFRIMNHNKISCIYIYIYIYISCLEHTSCNFHITIPLFPSVQNIFGD